VNYLEAYHELDREVQALESFSAQLCKSITEGDTDVARMRDLLDAISQSASKVDRLLRVLEREVGEDVP